MDKADIQLGRLAGLQLSAQPSAQRSAGLIWLGATMVAVLLGRKRVPAGMLTGLLVVVIHWASETAHQLGHAQAARQVGYPMTGVRFWGLLSSGLYPEDEPPLPAAVHIERALGGPKVSLVISLILGVLSLLLRSRTPRLSRIAGFTALHNFFTFTVGSLLPLGWTDGSTLQYWRGKS